MIVKTIELIVKLAPTFSVLNDKESLLASLDQLNGSAHADCCLDLVSSKHPYSHAYRPQRPYSFDNSFLQFVLNPRDSNKIHPLLNFVSTFLYFFLAIFEADSSCI